MHPWRELSTDIREFEAWVIRVGDYHAKSALSRFWSMKRDEQLRIEAADKVRFVETDTDVETDG